MSFPPDETNWPASLDLSDAGTLFCSQSARPHSRNMRARPAELVTKEFQAVAEELFRILDKVLLNRFIPGRHH